jgi:heme oxygenase
LNIEPAARLTCAVDTPAQPSTIARLRKATWSSHQRLEKRIDVKSRFGNLASYQAHLENLHGFCAALEARVPIDRFGDALPDYQSRRKLAMLARDLQALGRAPDAIAHLPHCPDFPVVESVADAFGCVYVLEGATLGGRTLLTVVASRVGVTATHGASFLASYGDEVEPMWARFGAAIDAWCHEPVRRAQAEAAAIGTFESLERWLCRTPA